ncbi:unnamed protein product, partial [Prorocentrum cordatum]
GGGAYSGAASYSGAGAGTGGFGGGFQQQAAQAAFNDPALQQHIRNQAFEQAQQGWNTARDGLGEAIQQLGGYVQEPERRAVRLAAPAAGTSEQKPPCRQVPRRSFSSAERPGVPRKPWGTWGQSTIDA